METNLSIILFASLFGMSVILFIMYCYLDKTLKAHTEVILGIIDNAQNIYDEIDEMYERFYRYHREAIIPMRYKMLNDELGNSIKNENYEAANAIRQIINYEYCGYNYVICPLSMYKQEEDNDKDNKKDKKDKDE